MGKIKWGNSSNKLVECGTWTETVNFFGSLLSNHELKLETIETAWSMHILSTQGWLYLHYYLDTMWWPLVISWLLSLYRWFYLPYILVIEAFITNLLYHKSAINPMKNHHFRCLISLNNSHWIKLEIKVLNPYWSHKLACFFVNIL